MSEQTSFQKRSFGAQAASAVQGDDEKSETPDGLPTKVIVSGVVMFFLGIAGFLGGIVFAGTTPTVSEADADEVFEMRAELNDIETNIELLPDAQHAERHLTRALESASTVAELQNNFRIFAGDVEGNTLDETLTSNTSRSLRPLFDPAMDADLLEPWYLLASDAEVPVGTGMPEMFDSGYSWQPMVPELINKDGSVPVTWIAVEQHPNGDRSPAVLAWAQANYDTTRQVFADVTVGTTTTGQALGLEVRR